MSARDPASTQLRAMAAWIAEHGFSPRLREGSCGCFFYASIGGDIDKLAQGIDSPEWLEIEPWIADVVGANFSTWGLRAAGWDETATDDAVAACLIAADLAECEE